MTTCLGKSNTFCLLRVSFMNVYKLLFVLLSLLVLVYSHTDLLQAQQAHPDLLQAQQALSIILSKFVGRHGT